MISQLSDLVSKDRKSLRALLEHRSIFDINVKHMDFLVFLGNDSLVVDPDQ